MKNSLIKLLVVPFVLLLAGLACRAADLPLVTEESDQPKPTRTPGPTATPLPPKPVQAGDTNPDEPAFITGDIPYTSPFFLSTLSEAFVLLEDQAGFVARDEEFEFNLDGQAIGPVELHSDDSLTFSLALPSIPQGTQVDVDNDGEDERGVQIFAVAYWNNTWGGPFLEERDGHGWSTAYASTTTDPDRDNEIIGGILVVWAPDDEQSFPSGFGDDNKLFTEDDPSAPIPAGYNLVDLEEQPFRFYKETRPSLTLNEGVIATNDFSDLDYDAAFEAMFEKAAREYPFTVEKGIDWEALHEKFSPLAALVNNDQEFYRLLRDFTWSIPDGHVGVYPIDGETFYDEQGGGFGMTLVELSDGRIIVKQVLPDLPAAREGIQPGAEIITWDGKPAAEALAAVTPYFGPYSSEHVRRIEQAIFLTRVTPNKRLAIEYRNPGGQTKRVTLQAEVEYESLFANDPGGDPLAPPVVGHILQGTNLGYLRINTFSGDYALTAKLWEHYIQNLIDNQVEGLIIDLRSNSGGSMGLGMDFAGYFFEDEIELYTGQYYNDLKKDFEPTDYPVRIQPAPLYFEAPLAVLIGPYCVSACEGFAYALSQDGRATLVGHYPTAGAFGEVGQGQYSMPGGFSMQFPTGRPVASDGSLVIEGQGVAPNVTVPVSAESALGEVDAVLDAAIDALK